MTFYISALLMLLSLSGAATWDLSKNPYLGACLIIGTIFRCLDLTISIGPFRRIQL